MYIILYIIYNFIIIDYYILLTDKYYLYIEVGNSIRMAFTGHSAAQKPHSSQNSWSTQAFSS